MAQNNTSRKSAIIAGQPQPAAEVLLPEGCVSQVDEPDVNDVAVCSPRELLSYVAEMADSLADMAARTDDGDVVSLLRAAGRKARKAAVAN